MGLIIRKRANLTKAAHVNLSKTGGSLSTRVGHVTLTSRGSMSVRVLPGVSYRTRSRKGLFG